MSPDLINKFAAAVIRAYAPDPVDRLVAAVTPLFASGERGGPEKSGRQMMDELSEGIARIEARRAAETARKEPERRRAMEAARRSLAELQQDDGLAVAAAAAWPWAHPHPVQVF